MRNKDVKLTYNGRPAQKTFTVALKRLTEIKKTYTHGSETTTKTWIFTDSRITHTLTKTNGSNTKKEGSIYTYKALNMGAKTFTAHKTHEMFNGTWYEIGSAEHKAIFMQEPEVTEAEYTEYVNNLPPQALQIRNYL